MKQLRMIVSVFVATGILTVGVSGFADDTKNLQKAQNTINNVKQAEAPKASSTPKASPVGQPVTSTSTQQGYKPAQKSPESKKIVVPLPSK